MTVMAVIESLMAALLLWLKGNERENSLENLRRKA